MKDETQYHQFDVVQVKLGRTQGSEQSGIRPCVILETNALVGLSKTVLVAPCTTKRIEKVYPHEVSVGPSEESGLTQLSKIQLNQIRVIDKVRIKKHLGVLSFEEQEGVLQALTLVFDFQQYFPNKR